MQEPLKDDTHEKKDIKCHSILFYYIFIATYTQ